MRSMIALILASFTLISSSQAACLVMGRQTRVSVEKNGENYDVIYKNKTVATLVVQDEMHGEIVNSKFHYSLIANLETQTLTRSDNHQKHEDERFTLSLDGNGRYGYTINVASGEDRAFPHDPRVAFGAGCNVFESLAGGFVIYQLSQPRSY